MTDLIHHLSHIFTFCGLVASTIGFLILFNELLLSHRNERNSLIERSSKEIFKEVRVWIDEAVSWMAEVDSQHPSASLAFVVGEFAPSAEPLINPHFHYLGIPRDQWGDRRRSIKQVILQELGKIDHPSRSDFNSIAVKATSACITDLFDWKEAGHAVFYHDDDSVLLSNNVSSGYFDKRSRLVRIGLRVTLVGIVFDLASLVTVILHPS